jgi:hypothetical protein
MTHPPDSTESAKARANEPAPRGEVMYLERIGWRRLSEAEYADPDRRAEMMRDAKQAVDVLNRLSSRAPLARLLHQTKPEPSSGAEGARKPRKPTLANVAKQVSKAGIDVSRYEVKPDSTIVIVTGQGESIEPNPWLDDLKVTKQ